MGSALRKFVVFLAATFGIASAQGPATVKIPEIVKAGETVSLDITLDNAPNFDGGYVSVRVEGPQDSRFVSGCEVRRGERGCTYVLHLPADAPGGTWYVSKLLFVSGAHKIDLPFEKLPFQVIANLDLVFPTSAEVAVNPSQVQLLRREATRLQTGIQALKAAVVDIPGASSRATDDVLRRQVLAEIGHLRATESSFHDLNEQVPQAGAAQVFFGDLRTGYEEALAVLSPEKSESAVKATLLTVALDSSHSVSTDKNRVKYPLAAQAVFRVIELNELAYALVADTGELTFDLEVSSLPEGASVSYRRRGDPYHDLSNQTNSIIKGLPLAVWLVRFQKSGFRDKEIEHNPFTERNHTVTVELSKK